MRITLAAARVNVKMTQEEAAKQIGVTKCTIINWETGKTFPKADKIPIICAIYQRKYDEINWMEQ